jgi:hypothetical protein
LLTFAVVFYSVERRRGKAAWKQYAAEARNRGVRLYPDEFRRPAIPNDKNFDAIPYFEDYYRNPLTADDLNGSLFRILESDFYDGRRKGRMASEVIHELTLKSPLQPKTRKTPPDRDIDLSQFAGTSIPDTSKAILSLLDEESAPVVKQLREAIDRPYCQFPSALDKAETRSPQKPPYLRIRKAAQLHAMRLTLHAAAHDGNTAFEDLRGMLRLAEALKDEPTLVSAMIRVSIAGLAADCIWSGLNENVWDNKTLGRIDELLTNLNLVATYRFGFETERAYCNRQFQQIAEDDSKRTFRGFVSVGEYGIDRIVLQFFPTGWVYRNQIKLNQLIDLACSRADLSNGTLNCEFSKMDAFVSSSGGPRNLLFLLAAPDYVRPGARTVTSEALVRQGRTACALERYRLKNSVYPETLDALVASGLLPAIPRDPSNNAPMEYRRTDDGRYALKATNTARVARETQVVPPEWPDVWMPAARK